MNHGQATVIGVDFDNTLVSYDRLIHQVAMERGLIDPQVSGSKKQVRDSIRNLPGGEIEWQKVQALVYGPRMHEAVPAEGAVDFLRACARRGFPVHVVSHKTEYANFDDSATNLRSAALTWIQQHHLFDDKDFGLSRCNVHFESSRSEKLERIRNLGCTYFIDDLEETFLEDSFPSNVEKILYTCQRDDASGAGVNLAGDWPKITEYFFHAAD